MSLHRQLPHSFPFLLILSRYDALYLSPSPQCHGLHRHCGHACRWSCSVGYSPRGRPLEAAPIGRQREREKSFMKRNKRGNKRKKSSRIRPTPSWTNPCPALPAESDPRTWSSLVVAGCCHPPKSPDPRNRHAIGERTQERKDRLAM